MKRLSFDRFKSHSEMVSDVSLKRRIAALILDGLILGTLWFLLSTGTNYLRTLDTFEFAICFFSLLVYIFWDFWYFPYLTGFTLSRWLMGYSIQGRDGKNPSLPALFKRGLVLWAINFLLIDIVSLFSILIRKDNRAIHDVFSSTVTRKRNVPFRSFRIFITLLILIIFVLSGLNVMFSSAFLAFVLPTKVEYNLDYAGSPGVVYGTPIKNNRLIKAKASVPDSPFHLCLESSDTAIFSDSYLYLNRREIRIRYEKRPEKYYCVPDSIIEKHFKYVPKSWKSEDLYDLANNPSRVYLGRSQKLLQPVSSIRFMVANVFDALAIPRSLLVKMSDSHTENVIITGKVLGQGHGIYAWIEDPENSLTKVLFELNCSDTTYSLVYEIPESSSEIARYVLENTGFEPESNNR